MGCVEIIYVFIFMEMFLKLSNAPIDTIKQNFESTSFGGSSRKPRTVKSARVTPVKTNRTYKG